MHLRRSIVIFLCLGLLQCSSADAPIVGAPCTPSLEADPAFSGFRVKDETIEVGSPECGSGVCLVNHFQGRVGCPLGQPSPKDENGQGGCEPERDGDGNYVPGQGSCAGGHECVEVGSDTYACHKPGDCQIPGATNKDNAGKACCLPGTDTPVVLPVCGQCAGFEGDSPRAAANSVYCTCRCGVAEGQPDEPDYPFCTCPQGFECSEIRRHVGVGDPKLAGKYCIRADTMYDPDQDQCGQVDGYWVSGGDSGVACSGVGTGQCQISGGSCDD